MSIYDKSSLVLIPSGTKAGKVYSQKPTNGDGDFTFTRSSAATRVNADGNIEKETGNYATYSNTQTTHWTTQLIGSVTGGQSGYDGSSDAWLLTPTASTGQHHTSNTITGAPSGIYTWSAYVKAGGIGFAFLQCVDSGGGNFYGYFNLSDGSSTSNNYGGSGTIIQTTTESIGGGWYRLVMVLSGSGATSARIGIANGAYAGAHNITLSVTDTIYIQDAQLEQGLVARDYQETTTSAVYGGITDNVPRLDYTDSSCPALLLEPQRTNIIDYSEYFGAWTFNSNITLTHNHEISPEGVQNATLLARTTSGNVQQTKSVTSGTTYAISVFAKEGTSSVVQVSATGTLNTSVTQFDLSDQSITTTTGSVVDSDIEDYGDGWYRCWITQTAASTGNGQVRINTGDNVNILLYGAQLEAASYATSYIPTYGSSVSRVQDNTLNSSAASVIGQTEGSIYAEVDFKAIGEESRFVQLSDGTNSNRFLVGSTSSNGVQIYVVSGGVVQWTPATTPYTDGIIKVAVAYKNNDYAMYVNGTQINTSSSASVPTMDEISVGYNSIVGNRPTAYGHRKVMLFKTRLSNEELADLTTL